MAYRSNPPVDACDAVVPDWLEPLGARDTALQACRAVSSTIQHDLDVARSIIGGIPGLQQDLSNALAAGVDFTRAIENLSPIFGRAGEALRQSMQWLAQLASDVGPSIDPTRPYFDRANGLQYFDPTWRGSDVYKLIMAPEYTDAADMLAISVFLGAEAAFVGWLTISSGGLLLPVLAAQAPTALVVTGLNLSDRPTPYLKLLRDAVGILTSSPGTNVAVKLGSLGTDFLQIMVGVPVSPATALLVGVYIVMNIPMLPWGTIAELVANDPVFQDNFKQRGVPGVITDQLLPATAQCMQASSADSFLRCAQGAIDVALPGLVQRLRDHGLSLTDVRVVVSALWRSGGDLRIAFDRDRNPGALESLLALGVAGLIELDDVLNGTANAETLLTRIFGARSTDHLFLKLNKLIAYTKLLAGVYADERDLGMVVRFPDSDLRSMLKVFNDARWDLATGFAVAHARGMFTNPLQRNAQGHYLIPVNLRRLLIAISSDPDLRAIAPAFCELFRDAQIGTSFCPALPSTGPTTVPAPSCSEPSSTPWLLLFGAGLVAALASGRK